MLYSNIACHILHACTDSCVMSKANNIVGVCMLFKHTILVMCLLHVAALFCYELIGCILMLHFSLLFIMSAFLVVCLHVPLCMSVVVVHAWNCFLIGTDITPRVQSLDVTAIVSSESPGLPISWHSLAYGTLRLLEETAAVVSTHTSLDRVPNNHYSLMTSRPLSYPINESSELWSISLRPWDQFQESYRLRTHRRRASGAAGAMVGTLRGITRKCDPNRHHVVLVFGLGEDMEGESSSILKEISSCKTTRIRVSVFAVGLEDLVNPAVRHINTYSDTDTLSLSSVVNFTEGSYASFISVAGNTSDRFRLQNGLVSDIFRRTHASQQYKPEHRCNLRATKPTSPASPDGLLTPGSSIFPKWHAGVKAAAVTASAVTPDQKSHTSTTVTRDLEADISIVTPGKVHISLVVNNLLCYVTHCIVHHSVTNFLTSAVSSR